MCGVVSTSKCDFLDLSAACTAASQPYRADQIQAQDAQHVVRANKGGVEVEGQGHGRHCLDTPGGIGEPELAEGQAKDGGANAGDGGREGQGQEDAAHRTWYRPAQGGEGRPLDGSSAPAPPSPRTSRAATRAEARRPPPLQRTRCAGRSGPRQCPLSLCYAATGRQRLPAPSPYTRLGHMQQGLKGNRQQAWVASPFTSGCPRPRPDFPIIGLLSECRQSSLPCCPFKGGGSGRSGFRALAERCAASVGAK